MAGRIPIKINHVPAITARDVSVKKSRKQEVHVGAYGRIGRSQGQARYSASITDDATGFTLTYQKGSETYLLTDCGISEDDFSSDQDGKADQQVQMTAVGCERIS